MRTHYIKTFGLIHDDPMEVVHLAPNQTTTLCQLNLVDVDSFHQPPAPLPPESILKVTCPECLDVINLVKNHLHRRPRKPLSKTQQWLLQLIREHRSPEYICSIMGITRSTYHVYCYQIRERLGVSDLANLSSVQKTNTCRGKSDQLGDKYIEVLTMFANGVTYKEIAAKLGITTGAAMNIGSKGCRRLGITSRGVTRILEIRAALEALQSPPIPAPAPQPDPFDVDNY